MARRRHSHRRFSGEPRECVLCALRTRPLRSWKVVNGPQLVSGGMERQIRAKGGRRELCAERTNAQEPFLPASCAATAPLLVLVKMLLWCVGRVGCEGGRSYGDFE